jgi:RNA polymerase sigma factor (sigma-70 family)
MPDANDMELMQEYAGRNSEAAFAELVQRHINLVYSVALRFTGDSGDAQDVTQAVFIILAQKAAGLRHRTSLTGWLYETTRLTARQSLRTRVRRQAREQEAYMQSTLNDPDPDGAWRQLAPLLEEAMARLNKNERTLLALRFFENKTGAETAALLGIREWAAHKRAERAVEKLRAFFTQRGIVLPAAVMTAAISANSVQAAPVALAKTVTAVAIAKGAAASTSTLTLIKGALKIMAWTKMKNAIVVGASMILAAATISAVVSNTSRDHDARQILERVRENYRSLSSYSSTGETIEEIDNKIVTASFYMRLGRTNLYFVEYEQHAPSFTNKAAVWSDGSGDYFANDMVNKAPKPPGSGVLNTNRIIKSPFPGSADNLSMIWDVSGGTTLIVPAMFFSIQIPTASEENAWSKLVQPVTWDMASLVQKPDEKVGETDCHVLSIETDDGNALLWIGKEDFLIHQSQQRVKSKLSEATDSEVTAILTNLPGPQSLPPLPIGQMKRLINEGRKKAAATMKPATVIFSENKGTSGLKSMTIDPPSITMFTQTHENIVVDKKISPADFTPLNIDGKK